MPQGAVSEEAISMTCDTGSNPVPWRNPGPSMHVFLLLVTLPCPDLTCPALLAQRAPSPPSPFHLYQLMGKRSNPQARHIGFEDSSLGQRKGADGSGGVSTIPSPEAGEGLLQPGQGKLLSWAWFSSPTATRRCTPLASQDKSYTWPL